MKKGKHYYKWIKTRKAFLDANPPNHQGYYTCYICHRWILANEITVDHIVARSRAPALRYALDNLELCCGSCNQAKGSKAVKPLQITEEEGDELRGLW